VRNQEIKTTHYRCSAKEDENRYGRGVGILGGGQERDPQDAGNMVSLGKEGSGSRCTTEQINSTRKSTCSFQRRRYTKRGGTTPGK